MEETFGPRAQVMEPDRKVTDLLDVLRLHLAMDVAVLGMWQGGLLVVQICAGDGQSFGLTPGTTIRQASRVFRNAHYPEISRDVRQDVRLRHSTVLRDLGVGSYLMTVLTDVHDEPYGMLFCLAHGPRPTLQDRHHQFVCLAAAFLREHLLDLREMWQTRGEVWSTISSLLDAGGPRMVYQPIVHLETGAVAAVEALARFPARCCGQIRTTEDWFLDAHRVGLGAELELAAIRRAVEVFPDLPGGLGLAVNTSPSTLAAGLPALVYGLPNRDRLIVEITEHEDYTAGPDALTSVRHLRELGVRIAVDDAGTGFSGLDKLVQLRPDIIKIDHVLTRGINHDPARRAIASGLVELARGIGGAVIAEGIETSAERAAVVSTGATFGQGFLLGKPTENPARALTSLALASLR
jgi:EAL domain-containing protein (putative c-di-GMP-specific phosphodiesterase class I)